MDCRQHSVSYTLSRSQAIIVEYTPDNETDMFQIGRSSDGPIDFVVMDTIPGCQRESQENVTQSTISRFACRIIVERQPPHAARIYAAGFNSARNIFLGVRSTQFALILQKYFPSSRTSQLALILLQLFPRRRIYAAGSILARNIFIWEGFMQLVLIQTEIVSSC